MENCIDGKMKEKYMYKWWTSSPEDLNMICSEKATLQRESGGDGGTVIVHVSLTTVNRIRLRLHAVI